MFLKPSVAADFKELDQAFRAAYRPPNHPGFGQSADEFYPGQAVSRSNVQTIFISVFQGEQI